MQFKHLSALVLLVGVFTWGFAAPAQEAQKERQTKDEPLARTDRYGDPLPLGAIARLGTIRLSPGHSVHLLAGLPDRKSFLSVATGEGPALVSVWNLATGELMRRFEIDLYNLTAFPRLSPDGRILAIACQDRQRQTYRVLFVDLASGKTKGELTETGMVMSLAFTPDSKAIVTAGRDQTLRLWDWNAGTELRRFKGEQALWLCLAFSRDGKRLVGASKTHPRIQLWDSASGEELGAMKEPSGGVLSLALSPDGKTLATVSSNGKTLRLWDVATSKELRQLPTESLTCPLAFSPDGKLLAAGGAREEGTSLKPSPIHLFDVSTGRLLRRLPGHLFGVEELAFSDDGKRLVSGGGRVLRIWDPITGENLLPRAAHESYVNDIAFSPDGAILATGGLDGTIRLWERATSKPIRLLMSEPRQRVWRVAFTADGKSLVSAGHDDSLSFWDVATGRQTRRIKMDTAKQLPFVSLASSPDRSMLAIAPRESDSIRLLNAETGVELRRLTGGASDGRLLCFSPDGKQLAALEVSRNRSGVLRLWEIKTGNELRKWDVATPGPIAISSNGRTLFMGDSAYSTPLRMKERAFHDWDLASGEDHPFAVPQSARLFSLAISPDDRMLVWGDAEGTITLWDIAAHQVRRRLKGHLAIVESLVFAPDGKTLVSGSADTTALIWDVIGRLDADPSLPLSAARLQTLWNDLANKDAGKAFDAIGLLTVVPRQAVPMLKTKLRPAPAPAERNHVARLIADLESNDFAVREKAMEELRQLGERAEPGLREALKDKPALEARRRIEKLLEDVRVSSVSPENLRNLRALEVLEHIGTPEARSVLRTLADGAAAARLTREAKASLDRLNRRHDPKP